MVKKRSVYFVGPNGKQHRAEIESLKATVTVYENKISVENRAKRDAVLRGFLEDLIPRVNMKVFLTAGKAKMRKVAEDIDFIVSPDWTDLPAMLSVARRLKLHQHENGIDVKKAIENYRRTSLYDGLNKRLGLRDVPPFESNMELDLLQHTFVDTEIFEAIYEALRRRYDKVP